MDKLTCWIITVALCFSWCRPDYGFDSLPQHRSMGIHETNASKIALFLLYIIVCEIGKKLDNHYKCPVYCTTNHAHIYWEKYEENYEQEGNIQTVAELHRTVRTATEE
tara:strand:- start:462 stop:785 length:324 start_codon:yes stop_codon:yes gene_type:complete